MTEADARARRRTWVTGGALLVLSAIFEMTIRGSLMHYGKDVLWALGVLVCVIGLGRAGSITARRPFATTVAVVQVLIASPLAHRLVWEITPKFPDDPHAAEDASALYLMGHYAIVLILSIMMVVQIARARVLPDPWRWAPLWVLIWIPATVWLHLQTAGPSYTDGGAWDIVHPALRFGPAIAALFLGIRGIVLGLRARAAIVDNPEALLA